jgi:hypothetical protein
MHRPIASLDSSAYFCVHLRFDNSFTAAPPPVGWITGIE